MVGSRAVKRTLVRALLGSCDGLRSRDVSIDKLEVISVDCRFCCCIRKCPLLVARDLGRCFVTRDEVRPGQEVR